MGATARAAASVHSEADRTRPPRPTPSTRRGRWWATWGPHISRFAPPLAGQHAITLGLLTVCAVILGISRGFATVPATIGTLWMVTVLAPVQIGDGQLGFLPLLPALVIAVIQARRIPRMLGTSITVRGLRVFAALSVGIPAFITIAAWLVLLDASSVYAVTPPNLAHALSSTLLLSGSALVAGLQARIWRALLLRRGLPTWPVESVRLARGFCLRMLGVAAAAALASLLWNLTGLRGAYGITSGWPGAVGLSAVALAYLPNILIGVAAVLLGGQFEVGNGLVSLFGVNNVNLPPLPVLAVVPNREIPFGGWLLIVPAVVAAWTVFRYIRGREYIERPMATAGGSAVAAAVMAGLAAWLAGGHLGVYGQTGPLVWLASVEAAAWLGVPALALMAYTRFSGVSVTEDVEAETAPGAETGAEPGMEPGSEADAGSGAGSAARQGARVRTGSTTGAAAQPGFGERPSVETEPETGSETEPDSAAKIEPETAAKTQAGAPAGAEAEPEATEEAGTDATHETEATVGDKANTEAGTGSAAEVASHRLSAPTSPHQLGDSTTATGGAGVPAAAEQPERQQPEHQQGNHQHLRAESPESDAAVPDNAESDAPDVPKPDAPDTPGAPEEKPEQ